MWTLFHLSVLGMFYFWIMVIAFFFFSKRDEKQFQDRMLKFSSVSIITSDKGIIESHQYFAEE